MRSQPPTVPSQSLSEDAAHADFDEIARKASELLTALRVHGIDPHAQKEKAAAVQNLYGVLQAVAGSHGQASRETR
jgi:hypothetical protein